MTGVNKPTATTFAPTETKTKVGQTEEYRNRGHDGAGRRREKRDDVLIGGEGFVAGLTENKAGDERPQRAINRE
jgi:hypothetical protein